MPFTLNAKRVHNLLITGACLTLADGLMAQPQHGIGQWQDHFPYNKAISVAEGGGMAYCASVNALFRFDPSTQEIDRLTKVNALSDVGINGLSWNPTLGVLLVYYANGNLDLVQGDQVFNMGDIKRSGLLGNKTVYTAYMSGDLAYLGCGFGIVVVDLFRKEVRETWFIGPGGSQLRVNGITFHGDSIYAATQNGLFVAARNATNLASFTNWHKRVDLPTTMVNGPLSGVCSLADKLLLNYRASANNADTLLVIGPDEIPQRFAPLYGRINRSLDVKESPFGAQFTVAHEGDIHRYNADLSEIYLQYGYAGTYCSPAYAVGASNGDMWVADGRLGLVRAWGYDNGISMVPNGPANASAYRMAASGGALYVATGAVEGNWTNKYRKDGVHHYVNGEWASTTRENSPIMLGENEHGGAINDMMSVAVDPRDPDHAFAGSWDDGVLEFRGRSAVTLYNATNSGLQNEAGGTPGKVNVAGMDYDQDGTLWMTNATTNAVIVALTNEGNWYGFDPGGVLNGNTLVSDIEAARNGYKWVIRPRSSGLLVFNDAGTLTNTADDQYKVLNNLPGTGGLPSMDVYAVAEDLEGQVWVGTSKGIAVFYAPEAIFSGGDYDAQQILIEQDGNVQVLLETEVVSAIAVDGANRKWIGTETGGAFLISADGRTQIQHFTAENSPLPSNTISCIAIDQLSGEVYFGTDGGIISYRGDATEGEGENACAKVFPNPVRETYSGPVAITGLVRDSEVKITDMAGNLVYRTTSLGGQAIWNGNDMSGNRVSTGVYMILVADRFGSTTCNTKVLVVR